MAPSSQNTATRAQAKSGGEGKKKKHKGGRGKTQNNPFPSIDKRGRKRLKKARMKAEQERKKAAAAILKNLKQGEFTDGEFHWNVGAVKEKPRDGEGNGRVQVKCAQTVADDVLMVGTQTQSDGAVDTREKKKTEKNKKSRTEKHSLGHDDLPETIETALSSKAQIAIDTPEGLENPSTVMKQKHKLDNSNLLEVKNLNAFPLLTNGAAEEYEALKKKRKIKILKPERYINEHQVDHRTVLCDRCGTIGHYPEACVLGVVCFNCKS